MAREAAGFATLCRTLGEYLTPPDVVVLRGSPGELPRWMNALTRRYWPASLFVAVPYGLRDLPAPLDQPWRDGVNAWVCRGVECLPPIADPDGVLAALQGAG
jgi:uncharacterized protein YyaL (SSP411 family)